MPTVTIPSFTLESGVTLHQVPVAYQAWGQLNAACDNAVVVCHALTGNADAQAWWNGLVGPGSPLDPRAYFIVCPNVIGSPYGTVSPLSPDPTTGRPYGVGFPQATIRDTVRLHRALLDQLGVRGVALAIGGSMGGMQVLEWAFEGDFVRALAPIAVGGRHSAWCIGWSEAQRQAIYADTRWQGGAYDPENPPVTGLAAARMMAMIAYRSQPSFEARFGRDRMPHRNGAVDLYAVESYLRYQGQKLVNRFDANAYVCLTYAMDSHDVGRGRGGAARALAGLSQPALVLGISSDVLYPVHEQARLAELLPRGELGLIESEQGHDAFLIEFDQMNELIRTWSQKHEALLVGS